MSTQVLGDVELVTKQELEAALDAVVVPEDDINSKIEAAGVVLEQAVATAKAEVHSEVELANASGWDSELLVVFLAVRWEIIKVQQINLWATTYVRRKLKWQQKRQRRQRRQRKALTHCFQFTVQGKAIRANV